MKDEELRGEALLLRDLVQYGEGSVVSRTIIKQPGGNLTLFAFDKGQELSEHTTPFDAVVQIIDGEAEIIVGGKPITTREGQTVIMPANVPHALKATEQFKMLLTMVRA